MDAAIALIFNQDNHVLAIKRRDVPAWVFPGGGVEAGESAENAVIREALEETGYQVTVVRKIAEYTPINSLSFFTTTFECRIEAGQAQLGDETADIAFFPIDQLPHYFFPLHRDWLADALKKENSFIQAPLNLTYQRLAIEALKHPRIVLHYAAIFIYRFFLSKSSAASSLKK